MSRSVKVTINVTTDDIASGKQYLDDPVTIAMRRTFVDVKSVRIWRNGQTEIKRHGGGCPRLVMLPADICKRIDYYNARKQMKPFSFVLAIKYDRTAKYFP